jgi:hypothetical protein
MRIRKQLSPPSLPSVDPFSRTSVRSVYKKQKELVAMRFFTAAIVIGMLALTGASPAAAQSKPVSDKGTSVGVATTRDAANERKSYTQQAQNEVRIWQQKIQDFDTKVKVKATEAQASASKDLDDAWAQTKTASAGLETAGEKDWDSAKASFKKASDRLAVVWHKLNPADK